MTAKGYREPITDRLDRLSVPEPNSGCRLWIGAMGNGGHGRMKVKGKWRGAHTVSYEETKGPVPDGLSVLHRCDVRACIEPAHLFCGTHQENMADMVAKGRQAKGAKHGSAQLTIEQVSEIRSGVISQRKLAKKFGVSRSHVSRIQNGINWRSEATTSSLKSPPIKGE